MSDERTRLPGVEEHAEPEGREQSAELAHHEVHLQAGQRHRGHRGRSAGPRDKTGTTDGTARPAHTHTEGTVFKVPQEHPGTFGEPSLNLTSYREPFMERSGNVP